MFTGFHKKAGKIKIIICKLCKLPKPLHAKGFCALCYENDRQRKKKEREQYSI